RPEGFAQTPVDDGQAREFLVLVEHEQDALARFRRQRQDGQEQQENQKDECDGYGGQGRLQSNLGPIPQSGPGGAWICGLRGGQREPPAMAPSIRDSPCPWLTRRAHVTRAARRITAPAPPW